MLRPQALMEAVSANLNWFLQPIGQNLTKPQKKFLRDAVRWVFWLTEKRGVLVVDRGGDARALLEDWIHQDYRFVVRLRGTAICCGFTRVPAKRYRRFRRCGKDSGCVSRPGNWPSTRPRAPQVADGEAQGQGHPSLLTGRLSQGRLPGRDKDTHHGGGAIARQRRAVHAHDEPTVGSRWTMPGACWATTPEGGNARKAFAS